MVHIVSQSNKRLGYHYFSDTIHFRQFDVQSWLPILSAIGASWLTITSSLDRSIPEPFITKLKESSIEPIIQFAFDQYPIKDYSNFQVLLDSYKKWGVNYVTLSLKPNLRKSWSIKNWIQSNLIKSFVDDFKKFAQMCITKDLPPILPTLEPGGDFWDLIFLQMVLMELKETNERDILDKLIISAQAHVFDENLEWGLGGPERWCDAQPYFSSADIQNQCGFFIFEWYLDILNRELGETRPIILTNSGFSNNLHNESNNQDEIISEHSDNNLKLIRYVLGDQPFNHWPILPEELLCCSFPLLNNQPINSSINSWIQPNGDWLPIIDSVSNWISLTRKFKQDNLEHDSQIIYPSQKYNGKEIFHYLLLPVYTWGVAEWEWDSIRPYILKNHPTVGFSIEEALHAKKVTILSSKNIKTELILEQLSNAGCKVEILNHNGTVFASE